MLTPFACVYNWCVIYDYHFWCFDLWGFICTYLPTYTHSSHLIAAVQVQASSWQYYQTQHHFRAIKCNLQASISNYRTALCNFKNPAEIEDQVRHLGQWPKAAKIKRCGSKQVHFSAWQVRRKSRIVASVDCCQSTQDGVLVCLSGFLATKNTQL